MKEKQNLWNPVDQGLNLGLTNQVTTLSLSFLIWKIGVMTYLRGWLCRSHKPEVVKHLAHLVTLWVLGTWSLPSSQSPPSSLP